MVWVMRMVWAIAVSLVPTVFSPGVFSEWSGDGLPSTGTDRFSGTHAGPALELWERASV